jgi:hypothetical protein
MIAQLNSHSTDTRVISAQKFKSQEAWAGALQGLREVTG